MANLVLFHTLAGVRPAMRAAADRLRAAGHTVAVPDLYDGETASDLASSAALFDRIGWATVQGRARDALRELPPDTIMIGFSMGAAVAQSLLDELPATPALVLLHSTGFARPVVRAGLPVQLHVADPDPDFAPAEEVETWTEAVTSAGAKPEVFRYPGVGHVFTDADLPDHDGPAAELLWQRCLAFLAAL